MTSLIELRKFVEDTMLGWVHKRLEAVDSKEKIKKQIEDLLEDRLQSAILAVLGLTKHWDNQWELDHCNGRMTVIDESIKSKASKAVDAWLKNHLEHLPRLDSEQRKAIKQEYKHIYEKHLRSRLTALAESRAREDAEAVVENFLKDFTLATVVDGELKEGLDDADSEAIRVLTESASGDVVSSTKSL